MALFGQLNPAAAQRFGYIDTEYIAGRMPGYQKANEEIQRWTQTKTRELADRQAALDQLQRQLKAEEPLLTETMKQQRLLVIEKQEQEMRAENNKIFGFEGQYYQRRKELLKPLFDEIFVAVERVAKAKQLMFLFDKSASGMSMIYTDPRHDYSDYVLEALGINPKPENQTNNSK